MDWTPVYVAAGVVLNWAILYFWQPWAAAYSGEKAKNFARKEDLDKILAEVEAITRTQKGIESKLAGDLWHHQTLRTEKKEVYASILTTLHQMQIHIYSMKSIVKVTQDPTLSLDQQNALKKRRQASLASFAKEEQELMRLMSLASIFATPECADRLVKVLATERQIGWDTSVEQLSKSFTVLLGLNSTLILLAKADLGITSEVTT